MGKRLQVFLLCALCALLPSARALGQQFTIRGLVTDTCGKALPSASVSLYSMPACSLVANAPCDSLGEYEVRIDKGQYAIGFSCIGYDTQMYSLSVDSSRSIGAVALKNAAIALDEVEVTANRSPYRLSGQTLLVDVEQSQLLNHQSDIYELLGKVPGVFKFGNSINIGGKGAPVYYINGRKVVNPAEVDNLQVDNIKSLKVVFSSDGTYDSNGSPVVDITTKRNGDGLAVNATSRTEQARHLSLKDGFSSTLNTGKWDFFMDYYYGHSKSSTREHFETAITNQSLWEKNGRSYSLRRNNNHYYHIGTAYHLSEKSQIGLRYTGYYANSDINSSDSLAISSDKALSSTIHTARNGHSHPNSHHVNAYYDASLAHAWNVNASADYIHSESKDRDSFVETGSTNDNYRYTGDAHWNVISTNLHLSHQFGQRGTLRFGFDFSHTQGTNGIFYDRSQHNGNTKNRETRNALFANYELPLGTFTLQAGLRYENVQSKLRETYLDSEIRNHYNKLLPSLSVSQSKGLFMQSLGYSIETSRPYYSNMNENEAYTNRYSASKGNIDLRTEVSHNISYMLMYNYLLFTLNYNYFHHPLMNYFYGDDRNTPTEVATMTNFSHKQQLSAMINLQPTIKCWTPRLSVVMMKTFIHYPGIDGSTYHDGKPVVMATLSSDWQLPKDLILSAGYMQTFGGDLQMVRVKPFSSFDVSVKKSLLNDRLRISLFVSDIFNGDRNKTTIRMNNIVTGNYTKYETRKFGITITYRFRNVKEKNSSNSAKDEMRRLNIKEE